MAKAEPEELLLDIHKELSLDFLGEAWKECKLVFRPISIDRMREILVNEMEKGEAEGSAALKQLDNMRAVLKQYFIKGTVIAGGAVHTLKQDEVTQLPPDIARKAYRMLIGIIDPNSETPSNPS